MRKTHVFCSFCGKKIEVLWERKHVAWSEDHKCKPEDILVRRIKVMNGEIPKHFMRKENIRTIQKKVKFEIMAEEKITKMRAALLKQVRNDGV